MNNFKLRFVRRLSFFIRDTSASVSVESVFIFPLLAAWFVGSFVFFDAFKSRNTAAKASYTISDVLSRRTADANPAYLDNLHELYKNLVRAEDGETALRVSIIQWDGTDYVVEWSHSSSVLLETHTDQSIEERADRIPILYEGEHIILVETYLNYNPAFDVGLNSDVWENFVVTSPRFASKLDCPTCTVLQP
ncbi:MAG: pilus assembly protein [Litoreibacter sp.]